MTFNPEVTLGSLLTALGMIVSVVSAFYAIERRQEIRMNALRNDVTTRFEGMTAEFSKINVQLTALLEGDVRELRSRVVVLESGQSEWIKTIRERTHDLANMQQSLIIRIDRLERPNSRDGRDS